MRTRKRDSIERVIDMGTKINRINDQLGPVMGLAEQDSVATKLSASPHRPITTS